MRDPLRDYGVIWGLHFRVLFGRFGRVAKIDEQIKVGVVFDGGQVTPQWLLWRGRRIEVKAVPMVYEGKEGEAPLLYYSLLSDTAMYGVVWNRKTNIWRLTEVNAN